MSLEGGLKRLVSFFFLNCLRLVFLVLLNAPGFLLNFYDNVDQVPKSSSAEHALDQPNSFVLYKLFFLMLLLQLSYFVRINDVVVCCGVHFSQMRNRESPSAHLSEQDHSVDSFSESPSSNP